MKNYKTFVNRRAISNRIAIFLTLLLLKTQMVSGQGGSITIRMQNVPLVEVLNAIKDQTTHNIVFNHEQINKAPRVTVEIKDATVEAALDKVLENTQLEYQIIEHNIVIKPKAPAVNTQEVQMEKNNRALRGQILDRDSKISLPFANVVVANSSPQIGVVTDEDGYFKIEDLPVGRYTLEVSYVGYESAVLPEIQLGSVKDVEVTIELTETSVKLGEAVVSVTKGQPLNEMATVSSKSFSVEETKRYPASISDPARMAQVFAGVSTTDDASNEIVIRGNSPNWLLWRLEGVEIPSPNHFAEEGFTAGAVSILSTNMLGKSDFYTGAFSGEYGNALSGVFDLKLRNGNSENREYSAQVGVLGVEFAAEGPFKKGYRGSYLINYRYATFSLLNNINIQVSENTLPNYQDLSFKFNLPTKKAGTFALWGIGGNSDSDEKYYPDTTNNEYLDDGYTDRTKTGMYAVGLSHMYFPDNKSYFKTTLSRSGNVSTNNVGDMDTLGILHNNYNDEFSATNYRLSSFYNRKISPGFTFRSGISASSLHYDYFSEFTNDDGIWQDGIDGKGTTQLYQAYLQAKIKLSDKIFATAGLHYTHFALSKENAVEPRIAFMANLPNNQKLGLGIGMHSRHENLPMYFVSQEDEDGTMFYPNKSLGLTRSNHFVLSYEKLIADEWMIKSEVYYQDISKLPVPNNPDKPLSPSFNGVSNGDTLVAEGVGRNYGLELTVQKFFTNNYYVLFSGSLFEAKYKPLDNKWYNNRFNSNYLFNLVAGKEIAWGQNKMLSLNGKLLWTGGKPIIPIDLEASQESGETEFDMSRLYSEKTPDYFRLDVGLKLHFYRKKTEHIIAVDIQNVTNRYNVWTYFYNPRKENIQEYYMAGLIPIISYRIEF